MDSKLVSLSTFIAALIVTVTGGRAAYTAGEADPGSYVYNQLLYFDAA